MREKNGVGEVELRQRALTFFRGYEVPGLQTTKPWCGAGRVTWKCHRPPTRAIPAGRKHACPSAGMENGKEDIGEKGRRQRNAQRFKIHSISSLRGRSLPFLRGQLAVARAAAGCVRPPHSSPAPAGLQSARLSWAEAEVSRVLRAAPRAASTPFG